MYPFLLRTWTGHIFKSRRSRCSLVDGGGCTQVVEVSCLGFWCLMDPGVVRFFCCCLYWWRMKNSIQSLYCTYCIAENRHFGCSREEPRAWPTQNCLLFFFWWNHPESWGSIVNTFVAEMQTFWVLTGRALDMVSSKLSIVNTFVLDRHFECSWEEPWTWSAQNGLFYFVYLCLLNFDFDFDGSVEADWMEHLLC